MAGEFDSPPAKRLRLDPFSFMDTDDSTYIYSMTHLDDSLGSSIICIFHLWYMITSLPLTNVLWMSWNVLSYLFLLSTDHLSNHSKTCRITLSMKIACWICLKSALYVWDPVWSKHTQGLLFCLWTRDAPATTAFTPGSGTAYLSLAAPIYAQGISIYLLRCITQAHRWSRQIRFNRNYKFSNKITSQRGLAVISTVHHY